MARRRLSPTWGGQLASALVDSATARPHLKSMRPLAVTGTQRMSGLPDVSANIETLGLQVAGGKPEAFQKVVRADAAAIYAKIIKDANIRFAQ
jgi:tripartite-type tricarboxylate transporter receptor subunit TctC